MRFFHTSDWHLGRFLHGVSLLDDQTAMLAQFVEHARAAEPDAIVIAGDIYDRAVPPKDAVELLDETLASLVLDLGIPTLIIAGNHDGPERLGFASRMLEQRGLFIEGPVRSQPRVVTIGSGPRAVDFALIPYAAPEVVRAALELDDLRGHDAALRALCTRALLACDPERHKVAIAHAFIVGAQECESERALVVGGSGSVPADVFDGFDYVALGHLHRPQSVGAARVRYSGSPLKYSFSEVDHPKGFSLVEIGAQGLLEPEHVDLVPLRDLRRIEGSLRSLIDNAPQDDRAYDYILAHIDDAGVLLNAMERLRRAYPNALHIERPSFGAFDGEASKIDPRKQDPLQLFESFFSHMREGVAMSEAQREVVRAAVTKVNARNQDEGVS